MILRKTLHAFRNDPSSLLAIPVLENLFGIRLHGFRQLETLLQHPIPSPIRQ